MSPMQEGFRLHSIWLVNLSLENICMKENVTLNAKERYKCKWNIAKNNVGLLMKHHLQIIVLVSVITVFYL